MKLTTLLYTTLFLFNLQVSLQVQALTLTIPSYPKNSVIPDDYTFSSGNQCTGGNVSPQLIWEDAPQGTQSFAIVYIDENFNWLHWKLYDIDAEVSHIPENNPNGVGIDGVSDFGISAYGGPCPPSNTSGNYIITLYALNTVFNSEPSVADIQSAALASDSWLAFRARNDSQERHEYKARYQLTFVADWNSTTHPINFPGGAHFSPLYGNTHSSQESIWNTGGIASSGIENMAETGSISSLRSEINSMINNSAAENLIEGSGSAAVQSSQLEFEISESHPLFSMVTMIAPSPDWFIGVHDLDLRENGLFKQSFSVDLFPYDAGTDSGINYTSSNNNTNPQEAIQQITTSPFNNNQPLGRFEFLLLNTVGTPSPDAIFNSGFESP